MGKCRIKTCASFEKWGPMVSHYPGTHQYHTLTAHKFEENLSSLEKKESNRTDYQNSIGLCPSEQCMEVGYPGMACPRCEPKGLHQLLVKPHDGNFQYIDFYVSQHLRACKLRNFTVQRQIIFEHGDAAVGGDDSNDEDSLAGVRDGNIISPNGSVNGDVTRSAD